MGYGYPSPIGFGYRSAFGRNGSGGAAQTPFQVMDAIAANYFLGFDAEYAYTDTGRTTLATANGDLVAALADGVGSNHASNATSGNRPTFVTVGGKPALRFPPTLSRTLATGNFFDSSWNNSFTIFIVKEHHGIGGPKVLVGGNSTQLFIADDASAGVPRIDWYTNNNGTRYFTHGNGQAVALCLQHNGTAKRGEVYAITGAGEVTSGNATFTLGLTGGITLGDLSQGGGFAWTGFFRALHLYKGNLTTGEVAAGLAALRTRWLGEPAEGTYASGGGTKLVVCSGDSLTVGQGSTGGNDYPTLMATALGGGYTVTKVATGGESLGLIANDAETDIDALWSASNTSNTCVLWGGTNDAFFGLPTTLIQERYRNMCLRRRAKGFKIVCVTILPRSDGGAVAGFETKRAAFNTWLRANYTSFGHALADVAADTRIGDSGDETGGNYAGDNVHLNNTGYGIVEDIITPVVQSVAP